MNARFAELTSPGRAALASLGLWGPDAQALLESCLQARSGVTLPLETSGRFRLGRLQTCEIADDVVVIVHGARNEPALELTCHGGLAVVDSLKQFFRALGADECPWTAWLAHLATDNLAAEAALALAGASTLRAAGHLLDQCHGALRRRLEVLHSYALQADDDHHAQRKLENGLRELLLTATVGVHLVQPWRILVAGPVNAGKSSLLNALVGYERAITSPQPGTTRDLVSVQTAFAGWPMQLTDTAGWRPDASGLEGQGIAKMLQSAADADLVLWVEDATQPALAPPAAIAARPWLRVCNKIDLCQEPRAGCLNISAQTGVGLACLQQRIVATLVGPAPAPDAALLFTPRQRDAVARARAAARSADWRGAAQELADLLGALETRRLNPGVP